MAESIDSWDAWTQVGPDFLRLLEFVTSFKRFAREIHHNIPTDRPESPMPVRRPDLPGFYRREAAKKVFERAFALSQHLVRRSFVGGWMSEFTDSLEGFDWANGLFICLVIDRWGWRNLIHARRAYDKSIEFWAEGNSEETAPHRDAREAYFSTINQFRFGVETIDRASLVALSEALETLRRACRYAMSLIDNLPEGRGPLRGLILQAILCEPIDAPCPGEVPPEVETSRRRQTLANGLKLRQAPRIGRSALFDWLTLERSRSLVTAARVFHSQAVRYFEGVDVESPATTAGLHLFSLIGGAEALREELMEWMRPDLKGVRPLPAMAMEAVDDLRTTFDRLCHKWGWPTLAARLDGNEWTKVVAGYYSGESLFSAKYPDGRVVVQPVDGSARLCGVPTDPADAYVGIVTNLGSVGPAVAPDSETLTSDQRLLAASLHSPDDYPSVRFGTVVTLSGLPTISERDIAQLGRVFSKLQIALPDPESPALIPVSMTGPGKVPTPPAPENPTNSAGASGPKLAESPASVGLSLGKVA